MIQILYLLVPAIFAVNPDHWHSQIMLGQICFFVWLACKAYKIHPTCGLSIIYFGIYSTLCFFSIAHYSIQGIDQEYLQSVFDGAVGRSILFLLTVITPFIFARGKALQWWFLAFFYFALINSGVMIFRWFYGPATGLIGMDSVDGTFLALFLPLVIFSKLIDHELKVLASVFIFIAILLSKSSTPYGVICLEGLVYLFLNMNKKRDVLTILAIGLLALPIGSLYLGHELFNDNGRWSILSLSLNVMKFVHHYWQGMGTGSFIVLMPKIQGTKLFFAWLHNEPIQVLFEQGICGVLALIILYVFMVIKSFSRKPLFMVILAMGAQSFIQPCFRYFLFALFLSFVTRICFEQNSQI